MSEIKDLNKDGNVTREEELVYIDNWKNRRQMAWIALFSILIVTAILLFGFVPDARIVVLNEPITWFFFVMGTVVLAYFGFTTWMSKK